jgi:hypothetical protein
MLEMTEQARTTLSVIVPMERSDEESCSFEEPSSYA